MRDSYYNKSAAAKKSVLDHIKPSTQINPASAQTEVAGQAQQKGSVS